MNGALQQAAQLAEEEAQGLRTDAVRAMRLEDQSRTLYDVATDAIEAYQRARQRADGLRKLADHTSGGYNAWADQP